MHTYARPSPRGGGTGPVANACAGYDMHLHEKGMNPATFVSDRLQPKRSRRCHDAAAKRSAGTLLGRRRALLVGPEEKGESEYVEADSRWSLDGQAWGVEVPGFSGGASDMLGGEQPEALGRLMGSEEVVDRMDGNAERIKAEDEHKIEGSYPFGSPRPPTEHEGRKEEERSQEQTQLGAVKREWLGNTHIDRSRKLRSWVLK
jgi:hypothetical protein